MYCTAYDEVWNDFFLCATHPFRFLFLDRQWATSHWHKNPAVSNAIYFENVWLHEFMTWITTSYLYRYGKPLVLLTGDNRNTSHWSPAGSAKYSTTTNLWTCHLFNFYLIAVCVVITSLHSPHPAVAQNFEPKGLQQTMKGHKKWEIEENPRYRILCGENKRGERNPISTMVPSSLDHRGYN